MAKKFAVRKSFTFDGKRYYVNADTETEAEVKKALKLKELEEGKYTVHREMTLKRWAEMCMETYKRPTVAEKTYENYVGILDRCILREIGHKPISKIKPIDCQRVVNAQAGKSNSQINMTIRLMRFVFNKAVKEKLILENPADDLAKPKGTKKKRRAVTPQEREAFLTVTENTNRFNVFLLMYYCGCRPGEAIKVKRSDIELVNDVPMLHVRGTKTAYADRFVPMPLVLYERFKDLPQSAFVAPNGNGVDKMTDQAYKRCWHMLWREMNLAMGCNTYRNQLMPPYPLSDDFVPYCLRHTYCTDLQKKGVDIRTAQRLMGHADIRMTANVYTHVDTDAILEAAKLLLT